MPAGLDYAVFDFAVNSGPQRALAFKAHGDGLPTTYARINDICGRRLAWLKRLPTWPTFGNGWSRRVKDVNAVALNMVDDPYPKAMPVAEPSKPAHAVSLVITPKPSPLPKTSPTARRGLWAFIFGR